METEFDIIKENVDVEDVNDLIKAILPKSKVGFEGIYKGIEHVTAALALTITRHNLVIPIPTAPSGGTPLLSIIYLNLNQSFISNLRVIVNELLKPCRSGDLQQCRENAQVVKQIIDDGALIWGLDFLKNLMNTAVSVNSLIPLSKLAESSVYGEYITYAFRRGPTQAVAQLGQVAKATTDHGTQQGG